MVEKSADIKSLIPYGSENHPASILVATALSHVGPGGHDWVKSNTHIGNGYWCAATCCAVAKACGYAGVNMPIDNNRAEDSDNYGAGTFGGQIAGRPDVLHYYGGTRIMGPKYGERAFPVPGDFILFQWYGSRDEGWVCTHIGIVRKVDDNYVYTVEGNNYSTESRALYGVHRYSIDEKQIAWYARPDWTKVGGAMPVPGGTYEGVNLEDGVISQGTTQDGTPEAEAFNQPLYTTSNTREDATIREVAYLSKTAQPSIKSTGVKLSIINYTGMLSKLYNAGTGYNYNVETEAAVTDNVDPLDPVSREIIQFFWENNLPTSVGVGVAANARKVDLDGVSSGFMGWRGTRKTRMKEFCGGDEEFKSNLSSQLSYMWYELLTSHSKVLSSLRSQVNTKEAAEKVVKIIIKDYMELEYTDSYAASWIKIADEMWDKVVTQSTQGTSTDVAAAQGKIILRSGKVVTSGKSIKIPDSVNQSGICPNFTSFDIDWDVTTNQHVLFEIWSSQGRPSSHHIATISGYYLIATTYTLGMPGDIVSVVLKDGTYFNAIVGDSKGSGVGDSATNIWGHYLGSNNEYTDIIEWESIDNDQAALRSELQQTGFSGKWVDRIINYGSWLNG